MWTERLQTEDDLSSWTARDECWEVSAGGEPADGSVGETGWRRQEEFKNCELNQVCSIQMSGSVRFILVGASVFVE